MKNLCFILILSSLLLVFAANGATDKQFDKGAKTLCEITLNSKDEKQVFEKHLTPMGYQAIELAPEDDKDPLWFQKACQAVSHCDVMVISGHFGGLFFGQGIATTLPLQLLLQAKQNHSCPSLLDSPKQVYLMGCNTLASKKADHRTIEEYLSVLIEDGFPLSLAEQVAASRYLKFGHSLQQSMSMIFDHSDLVVGFDGRAPLGKYNGPMLEQAFRSSGDGLTSAALMKAFKGTNLLTTSAKDQPTSQLEAQAKSYVADISEPAWLTLLQKEQVLEHYDFILENAHHPVLAKILSRNSDAQKNLKEGFLKIFAMAKGLSEIQIHVLRFLLEKNLIDADFFATHLTQTVDAITAEGMNYVSAGQLCSIFKENSVELTARSEKSINDSPYSTFLNHCLGKQTNEELQSPAYSCLTNHETHDWGCLQKNNTRLDVKSCLLAASRNEDRENGDDMLWYCYTHLRDSGLITQPKCLELTTNFSILGNQLKMNWNCTKNVPPTN